MADQRETLLGYGPQGLALEVNPWQTKQSVESTLLHRGAIVGAWANVEAALIELAIRASAHSAYAMVRDSYPSRLKGRVAYLRDVLSVEGPLSRHRGLIAAVLDRYVRTEQLRNLMAHGAMTVLPQWGATFQMYKPKSPREITQIQRRFSGSELKRLAHKTARFSRAVKYLMHRLDGQKLLPPIADPGD